MAKKKAVAVKPAAPSMVPATEKQEPVFMRLSPDQILADDNVRMSLQPTRIAELKQNVIEAEGFITNIEVEPLAETGPNGEEYRLTSGFYRHTVCKALRSEGYDILLPAMVYATTSPLERLKRQLAENVDRESLSPIDIALGMRKMLDLGATKIEVRKAFPSKGGRKGNMELSMSSNSSVNIYLNMLDLPVAIQRQIHTGLIPVGAAYVLGKVAPEKREAVVSAAIAAREKEEEKQGKEEAEFLRAETKAQEAAAKEDAATKALEEAKAKLEADNTALNAKTLELIEAHKVKVTTPPTSKEEKAKVEEHYKALMKEKEEFAKVALAAKKALEKIDGTAATAKEENKSASSILEKARDAKAKKKGTPGAVTQRGVAQAAAKLAPVTGQGGGGMPTAAKLTAKQIYDFVDRLSLPAGNTKPEIKRKQLGDILRNFLLTTASDATTSKAILSLFA